MNIFPKIIVKRNLSGGYMVIYNYSFFSIFSDTIRVVYSGKSLDMAMETVNRLIVDNPNTKFKIKIDII